MAVLFPDDQLKIFDYNRVVKDLNGHSQETFLENLKNDFYLEKDEFSSIKPSKIFANLQCICLDNGID